jgi:replicative DNA helicase
MTHEYFELRYLKYLCKRLFEYRETYKTFPTLSLLVTIIRDELCEGSDILLRDQIIDYLQRVKLNPHPGDQAYVKDKSLDFCKKQALKAALEEAVTCIAAENYDPIVDIMKNAISLGNTDSTGHDFFEDFDARFQKITRITCPTGIAHLDKKDLLNGGLARGEIGVIVAPTGVGKSHFLVHVGAEALKIGKNVLHYTFELSETAVGIRYDSHICNIPSNDIKESKEKVKSIYDEGEFGRLIIKEYPTGSASVITIRNHIEKLMMKNFIPSVIIIDYADIMRSTRQYDSLRHELKLIYEELRNMAMDLSVPVWTASQSNREGSDREVVGLTNMGESYGKAQVADVILTLSRKETEKSTGIGRLFVAKNRAGRDGVLFPVKIDCAKSKLHVVENMGELSLAEAVSASDQGAKNILKSKWKEITGK